MSNYAYRDKDRKDPLYASQGIVEDRSQRFYCPNPKCDAHLYLCSLDGSKGAYFRATKPEFPHIKYCLYGSNHPHFNSDKLDPDAFQFHAAMEQLCTPAPSSSGAATHTTHPTGPAAKRPPRTISEIYAMCKSHTVDHKCGDQEVGNILLDDRSSYRYPKGCFGYHLVEGAVRKYFYDKVKQEIYLSAPLSGIPSPTSGKRIFYKLVLHIPNPDVFHTIKDLIYKNRHRVIVVAGDWRRSDAHNKFVADILCRKQVLVTHLELDPS